MGVIFALLDPDPGPDCGYGSGSRDPIESATKLKNLLFVLRSPSLNRW
jgi:hypothetical protein